MNTDLEDNIKSALSSNPDLRDKILALVAERDAYWLRSEIEKLEGMKMKSSCGCPPFQPQHEGYCWNEEFPGESRAHNQALTSIITRYKEELKVLENEK